MISIATLSIGTPQLDRYMHEHLGWQISIQFLGLQSYTFQALSKTEHYRCPQVFDSWECTYMAAQEWINMHIACDTTIDLLDVLYEDGCMSHQEHDSLVRDLRHFWWETGGRGD